MKIALFYNLNFGGAKRIVMEHAQGLKKKGHSIDLYTTNIEKDAFDVSPYCENIYTYNIDISSSIPFIKRFVSDYKNFFTLRALHNRIAKDIDNGNYDIVLVHPDKFTQSPFLLRFLQTPSAYYCQEPLRIVYEYSMRFREPVGLFKRIYEELTRFYRKKIDRVNVRAANLTIASCYYVRERMIESYDVFPKVVYCAVNESAFRPLHIPKKNQVFYIGAPSVREDGYDLAEEAIKLIAKTKRPKLQVISWKKENGDRLSEQELVTIYNESIATLSTSRLETFGLVPLESMACGTPVIATRISGHRETVINGKTGFLVDFEPKEIAEKIIFLLNNPEKASEMGKQARKHIGKSWTWKRQIESLEEVLETVLK
jgi:glycosyltransferase involved in cell wall biosynthesis